MVHISLASANTGVEVCVWTGCFTCTQSSWEHAVTHHFEEMCHSEHSQYKMKQELALA